MLRPDTSDKREYSVVLTATCVIKARSLRDLVQYTHDAIEEMEQAGTSYGRLVPYDAVVVSELRDRDGGLMKDEVLF